MLEKIKDLLETIKDFILENKKIVIIIASVLIVALIAVVVISTATNNVEYKAKYTGDGTKQLTVSVKGNVPEGYFWHVDGIDEESFSCDVVRENSKGLKLKLKGIIDGGYAITISVDNVDSNAEGQYDAERDVLTSLPFEFAVDEDMKMTVYTMEFSELYTFSDIFEDMDYPIKYQVQDGMIVFLIPDADPSWIAECSDKTTLNVSDPFFQENGDAVINVTPLAEGTATVNIVNFYLDYGVQLEIEYVVQHVNEDGEITSDTNSAYSFGYMTLVGAGLIKADGAQLNQQEQQDYIQGINEANEKVPLPKGAIIRAYRNMGTIDEETQTFDDGNDVTNMEIYYKGTLHDYVITSKFDADYFISSSEETLIEMGAIKKVEDVNGVQLTMFYMPLEEKATPTDNTSKEFLNEKITFFAFWEFEGVACNLFEDESTYADLVEFVSNLELK